MFQFPKRTTESDLRAFLIKRLLEANQAPRNYMVCVVTNDHAEVFVACSGSGDPALTLRVAELSNWPQQLQTMLLSKSQRDNTRKLIKKLGDAENLKPEDRRRLYEARDRLFITDKVGQAKVGALVGHFERMIKSRAGNARIADQLVVPTTTGGDPKRRPGTVLLDVSSNFGRRDCAEPRALQLAASSGHRLTGMTTIWFGDIATNPMIDERQLADTRDFERAQVRFNAAVPCEWCQANEARIMIKVADTIARKNPARPNLQRRHSVSF